MVTEKKVRGLVTVFVYVSVGLLYGLYILHSVFVYAYFKTETTKIQTFTNMLWKRLGKNVNQNSSVWKGRKR